MIDLPKKQTDTLQTRAEEISTKQTYLNENNKTEAAADIKNCETSAASKEAGAQVVRVLSSQSQRLSAARLACHS